MDMQVDDVLTKLSQLGADDTVPRGVRKKINNEYSLFKENNTEISIKINRLLDVLEELSIDPAVSADTRAQIWYLVSILESM